ncbi:hypothetical protein KGS77_12545 [Streptomyces sp. MST-110588]|nr:hypothetical protein KGS77_12545 [Streptomyces sp. MST-110588]
MSGLAQRGDLLPYGVEGPVVGVLAGPGRRVADRDALAGQPRGVRLGPVSGVQLVPGGQAAGTQEVVVAQGFADAQVGEDGGGDAAVQGLQCGGGADRHQQVGAVQDLAHVPVHQAAVGGQPAGEPADQLLVREFLDVRGVLARLAAQLDQHLPPGVPAGVSDGPAQQVHPVLAALRDGGLGGEHHGVRVVFALVGRTTEEGQRALGDAVVVRPHPPVHGAEALRVVPGVGQDDIRAVPQQQPVRQLLVDDADIAGDDDGAAGGAVPGARQTVQHGLYGAAHAGQHHHVVRRAVDHTDEVHAPDLPQRPRAGTDLLELADRGSGAATQQISVQSDVRLDAVRGHGAPFPSGVRIGEHGDTRRGSGTSGHDEDGRKAFRLADQLGRNKG